MGLIINSNVKQIQRQYVNEVANYFFKNALNPNKAHAYNQALGVYNRMEQSLMKLGNSISTTYSQFPNFHKGFPIHKFQSSKNSSMWFFAYKQNEKTGNIVVFDMKNNNDNRGQTFNTTNRNRGSVPQQKIKPKINGLDINHKKISRKLLESIPEYDLIGITPEEIKENLIRPTVEKYLGKYLSLLEGKDDYFDEDDVEKWFAKKIKDREFERAMKKMIAKCFEDFCSVMYHQRHFLKNQI